jgi:ankyrin repeat protein
MGVLLGETAFHQIAHLNSFKDLKKLVKPHSLAKAINQPNLQLQTPLHLAVQNGNSDYVEFLIDHGADLNAQDLNLRTPLHYAVSREKDDCFDLLLENEKAFVDAQDCEMKSPLHIAVIEGKSEFAKKLFLHNANANLFDEKLNSPIDYASANGNHEIVNIMIKSKENIILNLQSPIEQNQILTNSTLSLRSSLTSSTSTSFNLQMPETDEISEENLLEDPDVKTNLNSVYDLTQPGKFGFLRKFYFFNFYCISQYETRKTEYHN